MSLNWCVALQFKMSNEELSKAIEKIIEDREKIRPKADQARVTQAKQKAANLQNKSFNNVLKELTSTVTDLKKTLQDKNLPTAPKELYNQYKNNNQDVVSAMDSIDAYLHPFSNVSS